MDIYQEFQQLSTDVKKYINTVNSEEAIKNSSVLPFLKKLNYDIFNPNEVYPEFTYDFGIKSIDKVDYCILLDGKPQLIIECNAKDKKLEFHKNQLFKYFTSSSAKFAILTNGKEYQFYTDIDKQNIMDTNPFWIIDITNLKKDDFLLLEKLQKDKFDNQELFELAYNLKYQEKIIGLLKAEFDNPNDDFVKFIMTKLGIASKSKQNVGLFRKLIINSAMKLFSQSEIRESQLKIMDVTKPYQSEAVNKKHHSDNEKYMILGNERFNIQYYNEILVNTAEWLIKRGHIKAEDYPISFRKIRNLISFDKVHKNAKEFFHPKQLSNYSYIELHYSTSQIIKLSYRLLEHYGYSSDILEVKLE